MRLIITGKVESFWNYLRKNNYIAGKDAIYVSSPSILKERKDGDIIVLGPGWWYIKWVIKNIQKIKKNEPEIIVEYADGSLGEEYRDKIGLDNEFKTRFDIIDFE
jgi:hypothetical protein